MESAKVPIYDIGFIKSIPIETVLQDYGIEVRRGMFQVRNEKTPSCKMYLQENTWADFGGGTIRGGSIVDLAMAVEKLSYKEALQTLGERYSAPVINGGIKDPNKKLLSNSQYNNIGLTGSPAYRNILLAKYAESFTPQMMQEIHRKYNLPMNKLFETDPMTYASILKAESLPYMKDFYQQYLLSLHNLDMTLREYGKDSMEVKFIRESAEQHSQEYAEAYKAMAIAVRGTDIDITSMKPDYEKDLLQISKKSIEVGDFPYSTLKAQAGETWHMDVPYTLYQQLHRAVAYGDVPMDTPFSVHVKGDTATISYKNQDENTIKGIFNSMKKLNQHQQQAERKQPMMGPRVSGGLER